MKAIAKYILLISVLSTASSHASEMVRESLGERLTRVCHERHPDRKEVSDCLFSVRNILQLSKVNVNTFYGTFRIRGEELYKVYTLPRLELKRFSLMRVKRPNIMSDYLSVYRSPKLTKMLEELEAEMKSDEIVRLQAGMNLFHKADADSMQALHEQAGENAAQ